MKKNKKHFLVTGGTGFIGSAICKLLLTKGYKVTIFDNNSRGSLANIRHIEKELRFVKGDIRNFNKLNTSLKDIDAVIHLAYVNGTKYFYSRPVKILEIATKGIINVIDGCINKINRTFDFIR